MNRVEAMQSRVGPTLTGGDLARQLAIPVLISVAAVVVVLALVVRASLSAWYLLGIGHGLVPPEYYHVSGFVIVLATTLGQAVGWAGGSAISYYVMTLIGFPRGAFSWKVAMSIVYLGLAAVPVLMYHLLFGQPLLGLPQAGLEDWLIPRFPDAHWLLFRAHGAVDLSLAPLGVVFLGALWLTGNWAKESRAVQTILALSLLGTSLAVALSLAIHSTIAHVRILP